MDINELHKIAVSGEKDAENNLFQQLILRFRSFAKRSIWNEEDCEEIVQESLTIILGKYKSIKFETSFSAWAHNVLKNAIMNYNAKSKRRRMLNDNEYTARSESDALLFNVDKEFERQLISCLKKLSKKNNRYARIINYTYQGFLVKEICEKFNIKANNLYVILSNARSLLLHCLEKGDV